MTCTGHQPAFQKQLDGSKYAGLNCTCASGAMAADDDSCGKQVPTPGEVRIWTGDTVGGTNLAEVDQALTARLGINLDVRYRYPWADFVRRVNGGAGAILQGWYAPIRDSRFSGSETFGGNHAIYVTPRLVAMDPLADGRRTGIYKYHGESYPESLLRTFAGRLNVGGSGYQPLGDGLCYAAFTRDNDANYVATIRPLAGEQYRAFTRYLVDSTGHVTGHVNRRTGGFHAACSPPKTYLSATSRLSLVRINQSSSSYDGWYVSSRWASEV